jgi:hypothetical protein
VLGPIAAAKYDAVAAPEPTGTEAPVPTSEVVA